MEEEKGKVEEKKPEAEQMPEQMPEAEQSMEPEQKPEPEAPRMESIQPLAKDDKGPWQGGDGDTRDTASPPKKAGNGMAIASLVMGILSLVCCCCCYIGIAFGALGIIFALLSRQEEPMDTQAKVGLILSCIGVALNVVSIILMLLMNAAGAVNITSDFANLGRR